MCFLSKNKMKKISLLLALCLCCAAALAQDTIFNRVDAAGMKQGHWRKKYPNGKVAYKVFFVDDRPQGAMVRFHENGAKMAVIDYRDDGTAFAQLFSDKGALMAEGFYVGENTKHGLWKYYRSGKLVMDETYEMGKLHGASQVYYPDGKVYERKRFAGGLQEGVYERIDIRGQLVFEVMFAGGRQNGKARYYYDSGQIYIEGRYENGLRTGEWMFYEANGKVERKTTYTNGVAADQDEVDKKNSDYLKQMESQRGEFVEPEEMIKE